MKSASITLEERAREWLGKTVRKSMIAESNALYEVAKDLSALLQSVRDEALEEAADLSESDSMNEYGTSGRQIASEIRALKGTP